MGILNDDFVPEPGLAQSNAHHYSLGSSHRNQPDTPENWHRPQHEFMSDAELAKHMADQLEKIRAEHAKLDPDEKNTGGTRHVDLYRKLYDKYRMPNLRYLAAIERLPEGLDVDVIEAELSVPDWADEA